MSTAYDNAEARVLAYIYPRVPLTAAQREYVSAAAQAQQAFEELMPEGLSGMSSANDGVSISAKRTGSGICETAKAYLALAGLLGSGLPLARRI